MKRCRIETAGKSTSAGRDNLVVSSCKSCNRVKKDYNIFLLLNKASCTLYNHLGNSDMMLRLLIEGRVDDFNVLADNSLFDICNFLGTLVDKKDCLVCYDIKELGKQLKKIGMLIVQDQVWGRVTANRDAGKTTRYYMDEFHLLLREEQTAAYSVEIWKRFRKWGGIPTGITQNVKDLLSSREVENIFENSDFLYMLNQASGDRAILAKQLNISPHQLSYVTQSGEGEGLLFYGNVILPFVDHFPTDLELYKIMTTKWIDNSVQKDG